MVFGSGVSLITTGLGSEGASVTKGAGGGVGAWVGGGASRLNLGGGRRPRRGGNCFRFLVRKLRSFNFGNLILILLFGAVLKSLFRYLRLERLCRVASKIVRERGCRRPDPRGLCGAVCTMATRKT